MPSTNGTVCDVNETDFASVRASTESPSSNESVRTTSMAPASTAIEPHHDAGFASTSLSLS